MYYHRYLSLFALGDFAGVARDTSRNLRVLDLCGKFADDDSDRLVLEQYRPYIIMMNARAIASIEFESKNPRRSLSVLKRGIRDIRSFFLRFGQEDAYRRSSEAKVLRRFALEIQKTLPIDPLRKLERELKRAVKAERYEDAARLRDEIEKMRAGGPQAEAQG